MMGNDYLGQAHCPFLRRLPIEVRFHIFDQFVIQNGRLNFENIHNNIAPLKQASKQLQEEIITWFRGKPKLVYHSEIGVFDPATTQLRYICNELGDDSELGGILMSDNRTKAIRHLTLEISRDAIAMVCKTTRAEIDIDEWAPNFKCLYNLETLKVIAVEPPSANENTSKTEMATIRLEHYSILERLCDILHRSMFEDNPFWSSPSYIEDDWEDWHVNQLVVKSFGLSESVEIGRNVLKIPKITIFVKTDTVVDENRTKKVLSMYGYHQIGVGNVSYFCNIHT